MYCKDYRSDELASPVLHESRLTDPHIMTLMLFFVHLVATGSISSASERMGISVSSGSRWLSELEKESNMKKGY